MSPTTIADSVRLAGPATGTDTGTFYFDVPIAAMAKHLYFEVYVESLDANTTLSFSLEDSLTGDGWGDTGENFVDATDKGFSILRTEHTFANKARFKVEIVGTTAPQRFATVRITAAGKPF